MHTSAVGYSCGLRARHTLFANRSLLRLAQPSSSFFSFLGRLTSSSKSSWSADKEPWYPAFDTAWTGLSRWAHISGNVTWQCLSPSPEAQSRARSSAASAFPSVLPPLRRLNAHNIMDPAFKASHVDEREMKG